MCATGQDNTSMKSCAWPTWRTNFTAKRCSLLRNPRTNTTLFISCFPHWREQTGAREIQMTKRCRMYSLHCFIILELMWHAEQDCPCVNTPANTGGLGLPKTYKSGWEKSTPRSCLCWLLIDQQAFKNYVNGLENILQMRMCCNFISYIYLINFIACVGFSEHRSWA